MVLERTNHANVVSIDRWRTGKTPISKVVPESGHGPGNVRGILPLMRQSSIWFVIAAFWLADAAINLHQRHFGMALLTSGAALLFVAAGLFYRRRERGPRRGP